MIESVIIDTDVLIDAGRRIPEAVEYLQDLEKCISMAISTVTQMELIIGCRNKKELRSVEVFLSRFQIIKLNEQLSDIAVDLLKKYRLSHGLLIADALVAATAIYFAQPLITKNQRHFQFIEDLELVAYPKPLELKNRGE